MAFFLPPYRYRFFFMGNSLYNGFVHGFQCFELNRLTDKVNMVKKYSGKSIYMVLILFLAAGISCDSISTVCSSDFRYLGVGVYLEDGITPVVFDEVRLTDGRSGQTIDLCDANETECPGDGIMGVPENGSYTIFHDGLRGRIGFHPMPLLFEGRNDSITVEQLFVIGDDGCHVHKISGPGTLIAEPG